MIACGGSGGGGENNNNSGPTIIGQLNYDFFSTLTNPARDFGEYPHQLLLNEDLLYLPLGSGGNGIAVFDLFDLTTPTLYTNISSIKSRDISIDGSFLFSVDGNTLNIVDISNPPAMSLTGALDLNPGGLGAAAMSVDASGAVAYVTGGGQYLGSFSALTTIDISDPTQPIVLGYTSESGGGDVVVVGTIAYVASYDYGLRIYDVSDPGSIQLLSTTGTFGNASSLQVVGNTVYAYNGGYDYSLAIIDVSNPSFPSFSGLVPLTDWARPYNGSSGYVRSFFGFQIFENFALLGGFNGLIVVDISDINSPDVLGIFGTQEFLGGVETFNDNVIIASSSGITIY